MMEARGVETAHGAGADEKYVDGFISDDLCKPFCPAPEPWG